MKARSALTGIVAFLFLACACISCESGSSSSSGPVEPQPPVDEELVGSWEGHLLAGEEDIIVPGDFDSSDDENFVFDDDDDDIFVIGIITRDREAMLIGDESLFFCSTLGANDRLEVRTIFGGKFDRYTWNAQGDDSPYLSEKEPEVISLFGNAFLSIYFLDGYYWYTEEGQERSWPFQFLSYNSTSTGLTADVRKLAGTWEISNAFKKDNALSLTITTTGEPGTGNIQGSDSDDNIFDGEIIEIHYTDLSGKQGVDIYRVSLELTPLNEPGDGLHLLEGLAAYVSSYDSKGIEVERSLAIGATDAGGSRMVIGLAKPVDPAP